MRAVISFLVIALPLLYFSTIWSYAKSFFSGLRIADTLKLPLLVGTLCSHLVYVILLTSASHHPPITNVSEILTLISLTISLTYLYIEMKTRNSATGYFILMFPFFFQLTSSIFIREARGVPPILESNLLGFHVMSALLGYAAITISAVYGFLYLMMYHDIKSRQFSVIYKRLPNLEMLERMSFTATVFGFVFLTIAIIVGLIWLPQAFPDFSYADPKLLGTTVSWLLYAIGLSAKRVVGWQGRRMIVLSMLAFAAAMFSMTVVNMFFSGFHNFY